MQDNPFGHESRIELIPPEDRDGELLAAWDAFRFAWRRHAEGRDTLTAAEHGTLVRELDRASVRVIRAPAWSLEGIRAKLAMTLCSGPDAELFLRHFVHGQPLPELMPFRDFATSQVFDAIEAVERLIAAGARTTH
jgi:hypothetical protein